jgi:peptidoglycan/LPS O-acetylase OafA/YrhL
MDDLESGPLLDRARLPQRERIDLPFIQGLRFVAMAWIIAYHFAAAPQGSLERNILHHRPLDLFTVISGFTTQLTYGRRPDLGGQADYVARRLARVGAVYYMSLSFAFILRLFRVGMATAPLDLGREFVSFALGLLGLNVWVCPFVNVLTVPAFPKSEAEIPSGSDLEFLADQCYPHNGPLWYVQAIVFCWATYPAYHKRLKEARVTSTTASSVCAVLCLWCIANLPALITTLTKENDRLWDFTHVLPAFMLAPFYLGVACCELYERVRADGPTGSDDEAGDWHERAHRPWATLAAEGIFMGFCCVALAPYANTFFHVWSLGFGVMLVLFTVCAAERGRQYSIGICWLLESRVAVALGDVSLVAFAFQFPVGKLLFGVLRPTESQPWHPCTSDWMMLKEFVPFLVGLYGLSVLFGKYVDRPLSTRLRERLEKALAPASRDSDSTAAKVVHASVSPTTS